LNHWIVTGSRAGKSEARTMDKKKLLYALAGMGGVAAWLIFILACTGWPACHHG